MTTEAPEAPGKPHPVPLTVPDAAAPDVSVPVPARPAPSVHVRVLLTWLAIFPMVATGMSLMALFAEAWHPVLRSLMLTAVVVPLAVYLVVPMLLKLYTRWSTSRPG